MYKYIFCLIAGLLVSAGMARADEVSLAYRGLTLNASLELAAGKTVSDGVILITHAGPMHSGAALYVSLQTLLRNKGYSTLAINLSHGIDNRHGMYDCKATSSHRYADAADEIGAWVDWLNRQGAKRVVLLGHSRGGAQTALYASASGNASVEAVVLLAPDTRETNDADAYRKRYHKLLMPVLEQAQQLIRQGRGETVLAHTDFLFCPDASVTADTFDSYYGTDPRLDTAYLIPEISKPVLIVLAGGDEIVVNNRKYLPLADGKRVQIKVVDGANHFFSEPYVDDAVDAIEPFLKNTGFP